MLMAGVRRPATVRLAATAVAVAVLGCAGADEEAAAGLVSGPLCDLLPAGSDPGGPELLLTEPADVALQWIPVLTIFEAGARATGLDAELREMGEVTILAPTDDAFKEAFIQDTIDELILFRQDELRALLEAHLVDGALSVDGLLDAGTVETLAGDTVAVARADTAGMARFDDRAETVCADYRLANARIHVIDGVLGEHPEQTPIDLPDIG